MTRKAERTNASDKAPAYQWYPKDAWGDEAYSLMTYEERGVYRELLDRQWLEGSLPSEPADLARLLGLAEDRFSQLWTIIGRRFHPRDSDGRLINRRLERQRAVADAYHKACSANGKKGARARWRRKSAADGGARGRGNGVANGSAIEWPLAKNGSPSPSPSPSTPVRPLESGGERRGVQRHERTDPYTQRFERLWDAYPRKEARDEAWRAFVARHPNDATLTTMLAKIAEQKRSKDWNDEGGRFIPRLAKWLKDGRWLDATTSDPPPPARISGCTHTPPCRSDTEHTRRRREDIDREFPPTRPVQQQS